MGSDEIILCGSFQITVVEAGECFPTIQFERILKRAYNALVTKTKYPCAIVLANLLISAVACKSHPGAPPTDRISLSNTFVLTTNPANTPSTQPSSPMAIAMRESLTYLSSDELEGRGLDTSGIDLAAAFIAGNFRGARLQPVPGMTGYFQRFDMTTADGIAPETILTVNGKPLKVKEDYNPLSFSAEKAFDAPAVFVGYGITNKEQHYDDYADIDVKGKIAVAWRFEPVDKGGKSKFVKEDWSESAHLDFKAKNAADHGAVALILVNPPMFKGLDTLLPFAKEFMGSTAAIPVIHVKRIIGDALIQQGTGMDAKSLEEKIDEKPAPQSLLLKDAAVSGKVAVKRTVRQLKNVAAFLPGAGPHADEYVIVGAHYDHLGHGGFGSLSPKSREIHHGADDNGSGTVAVMELAQEFALRARTGHLPPRSIVFVTFTAEEEGLIGSAHFVSHPPIPLDKVVGMLNLDMVGRLRDESLFVGGAGTAPSLEHILADADKGSPIKLKDIGKGGRGPSDHMSFAMKKIPVLFFFTGLHADYHRPTDRIEKINFNGMAEIVDLSRRVIDGMTAMPKEQYITAADAHSMSMGMGSATGGERKASLGVVPSYGDESDVKGVRITGTSPGSPAETAGLKEGDVIVGFNEKNVDNLMDLSNDLASAKPGDNVKVRIIREKNELTIAVKLVERK